MNHPQTDRTGGAGHPIPRWIPIWLALMAALCAWGQERGASREPLNDVSAALAALPDVLVVDSTPDGLPRHITGDLARVNVDLLNNPAGAEAALRAVLARVVAPFRISAQDLRLRKVHRDTRGGTHFRFGLVVEGLDVIGGDLLVHVDAKGSVTGAGGGGRGDLGRAPPASLGYTEALARVAADRRFAGREISASRPVFLITEAGARHRALEILVVGRNGADPMRDLVYVDITDGSIAAAYPQLRFAKSRTVYSAAGGTSLPGTLRRSEGAPANTDVDVNAAYDNTGAFYDAYASFWGRDSYDNAGAPLLSTVHYYIQYCNAFWDGSRMVYGDGDGAACLSSARALDVTVHELTHAVTEHESGLVYSGEAGALNESLSDSFAAFVDSWVAGGRTGNLVDAPGVWLYGENWIPPFWRNLCDPSMDGASADYWNSSVGTLDPHYGSGVGNLSFCLLANGGTHPRGKSTVVVPSIGLEKAIRILYEAQVNYLTSTSTYAGARTAMEQAAAALGYDPATQDAVGCAWAAVNVGSAPASCNGSTTPPPAQGDGVLQNGVPVRGLSGAQGEQRFWSLEVPAGQASVSFSISGGTGDADLYVRSWSKPTLTSWNCRPYMNGNNETCTLTNPAAGTWWVMLNGYSAYTGVTLTGSYSGTAPGLDPSLTNGMPITALSGAMGSSTYWRVNTPAGKTLTISISGGTGDADLYLRFGQRPTTATYSCRPYLNGNNETCVVSTSAAGDYYVMLRGYANYSGVSLKATF